MPHPKTLAAGCVLLILFHFTKPVIGQEYYFPPVSGSQWDTLSPESLGWEADSLSSLQQFLEENGGRAFIILKDGKLVVEWYFGQFSETSNWYWASAGKTITAFLIGMAEQENMLQLENKSSDYLGTGWTSCPQDKEDLITIRHQLTMTTGLDFQVDDTHNTDPSSLLYLHDAGTHWFTIMPPTLFWVKCLRLPRGCQNTSTPALGSHPGSA